MSHSKTGGSKSGQSAPRHSEHNARGSETNPFRKPNDKADLLARMKAAAEKRKDS